MANTLKFGAGKWAVKEGSVLAYNDENNNYKPLPFTFTRASSATRVNESGLIEIVASGVPRIDYLNNADGHLLLEPSRTNQLIDSSTSGFSVVRSSRGNRSYKLGIVDGYEYSFTSANPNINYIYSENTLGYKTFSIFVDATNSDYFNIRLSTGGTADYGAHATFTPSTLSFTSITQNATYVRNSSVGYDYFGNNIYRLWITTEFILYSGTTTFPLLYFGDNTNVWIGGAQVEAGSYVTSYIPTINSSVTRVIENCYQDDLRTSVINSPYPFTVYAEAKLLEFNVNLISFADRSLSNRYFQIYTSNGEINFNARANGTSEYLYSGVVVGIQEPFKVAFVMESATSGKIAVNGTVATKTDFTSQAANANIKDLLIGMLRTVSDTGNRTPILDARLYNTALSDSELIALTS